MKEKNTNMTERPPVVVIMGHIDHGKSTLLDYIIKTNITEKEEGGITQHIRAYEVEIKDDSGKAKKITFLDTPGHEAFCSIRERGARIADIAILVVSAEDGLKPQTIEALRCIQSDNTPFIVAINKIDKTRANVDKIKQDLAENQVFVEGWGGSVPLVLVSAKTGENVQDLLEIITLQAELEELTGDSEGKASGFVIESNLNPKQGISSTVLIKSGNLHIGDFIATEDAYISVRAIENFKGENIKEATFSSPIRITGWNSAPIVGREFRAFSSKDEAIEFSKNKQRAPEDYILTEGPKNDTYLTMIIKADTFGSLEALEHELKKLGNEKIGIKIIGKGVGSISEGDVKTANIKKSLIVGFNIETSREAEGLSLREKIEIKNFKIIYQLIDYVKEKVKEATPITQEEVMTGSAKIIRVFSKNKDKQVIGGKMTEGEIKSGSIVKISRRENIIGDGKIKEIQTQKIKTASIKEGDDFGMMIESKIELVEGDHLIAITLVSKQ